jgi:hypothetical protein
MNVDIWFFPFFARLFSLSLSLPPTEEKKSLPQPLNLNLRFLRVSALSSFQNRPSSTRTRTLTEASPSRTSASSTPSERPSSSS